MITFNTEICNSFNQKKYDIFVNKINFYKVKCSCGHSGCLISHGYYSRNIIFKDNKKIELTILRVKCKYCGHTHAILPSFIVPYVQLEISFQKDLIQLDHDSDVFYVENDFVSPETMLRVRRQYKKIWFSKLASILESIQHPLDALIANCFQRLRMQFMQIHRGTNFFIMQPT